MRDDNLSANDVPLYVGGDIASGLPVYVIESVLRWRMHLLIFISIVV